MAPRWQGTPVVRWLSRAARQRGDCCRADCLHRVPDAVHSAGSPLDPLPARSVADRRRVGHRAGGGHLGTERCGIRVLLRSAAELAGGARRAERPRTGCLRHHGGRGGGAGGPAPARCQGVGPAVRGAVRLAPGRDACRSVGPAVGGVRGRHPGGRPALRRRSRTDGALRVGRDRDRRGRLERFAGRPGSGHPVRTRRAERGTRRPAEPDHRSGWTVSWAPLG